MINRKILILLMIFIFSTSFSSLAWSSENYEDCIYKNMKGIGSDLGAKEIIDLCKAKHLREGNYKDGKRDGKWTHWYEDGLKLSEENYKDGKRDGKWTHWYEDGLKLQEGNYKDGKRDGMWTTWYENGLKWTVENYKDAMKDGKSTEWFANGQIKTEENYKYGKKEI
jgi:antitoxin component YwqK of YwqJK toxin-antitoxin module